MTEAKTVPSLFLKAITAAKFIRLENRLYELLEDSTGTQFIINECIDAINELKIDINLTGETFKKFQYTIDEHLADDCNDVRSIVKKIVMAVSSATPDNQQRFFTMWFMFFPSD